MTDPREISWSEADRIAKEELLAVEARRTALAEGEAEPTPPPAPAEALESIARRVVEQSPRYATAVWPDVPDAEARDAELVAFLLADPRFVLTATAALAAGARLVDDAIGWDLTCLNCADRLNRLYEERAAGVTAGRTAAAAAIRQKINDWQHGPNTSLVALDVLSLAARIAEGEDHG